MTGSKIEVLVRKNRVVWQIETALPASKATLIAQLKKYASKQQRRIGADQSKL